MRKCEPHCTSPSSQLLGTRPYIPLLQTGYTRPPALVAILVSNCLYSLNTQYGAGVRSWQKYTVRSSKFYNAQHMLDDRLTLQTRLGSTTPFHRMTGSNDSLSLRTGPPSLSARESSTRLSCAPRQHVLNKHDRGGSDTTWRQKSHLLVALGQRRSARQHALTKEQKYGQPYALASRRARPGEDSILLRCWVSARDEQHRQVSLRDLGYHHEVC